MELNKATERNYCGRAYVKIFSKGQAEKKSLNEHQEYHVGLELVASLGLAHRNVLLHCAYYDNN